VSGQLYTLVALPLPIGHEDGWASEPVRTLERIIIFPAGKQIPVVQFIAYHYTN